MPTSTAPTPRAILTSLLLSLHSTQIVPSNATNTTNTTNTTNALQNAPPKIRSLLATLHVIYPQLLLPALDLLDRQLVTRVRVVQLVLEPLEGVKSRGIATQMPATIYGYSAGEGGEARGREGDEKRAMEVRRDGEDRREEAAGERKQEEREERAFYLVHSSQTTTRSNSRYREANEKYYTVRLQAWNCSCASFAFSAFPGPSSSESFSYEDDAAGEQRLGKEGEWEFGGLSADGKDGGAVPACKHLLACVLVERWPALRESVKERVVGTEECAGLGAGF